jgi:hypothetical protein
MPILSRRSPRLRAASVALLLALAAGCATPPGHPALEQADAAVERARRSPRVRALAAAELDRAEVALQDAREAARTGASPDRVEHLVYIVSQRAALAEARAAQQVARSEIEMLDRVLVQGRPEPSRQRRASFPARDQRPRATVQLQARSPLAENRQAQMPPQAPQPIQALSEKPRQADAPLQQSRHADAELQESRQADAPLQGSRHADTELQESRQADAPIQEPQQTLPSVDELQQAALAAEQVRKDPEAVAEAPAVPGSAQEAAAKPGPATADVEALPQELTLSLAQLSFAGAEPTSETAERLAAVAEQLLRAPLRRVAIEAEFNLPDPEARTMLEQRVEIVRAILLRSGVAPERVVVRASGDGPAQPRARSSFVEAPY